MGEWHSIIFFGALFFIAACLHYNGKDARRYGDWQNHANQKLIEELKAIRKELESLNRRLDK